MTATGTLAKIEKALFDKCAAMASAGPTLPVSFPEATFTVPADRKYLEVSHQPNKPFYEPLGSGQILQGLIQVTVHWANGVGTIQPQNAADAVKDYLAKGTVLYGTGVKVIVYDSPYSTQTIKNDADLSIPVSILYRAFLV